MKIVNGEPVSADQYNKDMKCAFQTVALDTINKSKEDFQPKPVTLDRLA